MHSMLAGRAGAAEATMRGSMIHLDPCHKVTQEFVALFAVLG
ncbi:MAG: hypothetical protein Q8M01_14455 [Rubrivivax sp.]|nr:hypothetical protein [Rubrivivax sp.]